MTIDPNTQDAEEGVDIEGGQIDIRRAAPPASPLDASLMRGNPRQRPGSPSLWDVHEPLALPSPTLDAQNIRTHPDFEALDGYACDLALGAMDAMQDVTRKVIEAREAVKVNGIKTDGEHVLDVFDLHTRLAPTATRKVDAAVKALDTGIATREGELRKAITEGATGPFASEIRAVVRGMSTAERHSFITQAVANGDAVAVGAVLGAPPVLTGLDAKMVQALTERANTLREPKLARQLSLMRHARDKLNAAASVFVLSTDKMIGARDATVRTLRGKRDKLQTVIGGVLP